MPITTIWDNESNTIIRHIYEGSWTWDDFYTSMKTASDMAATVSHAVGLIVDVRDSNLIPQGLVTHINRLHTAKPTWTPSLTVLVGANAFVKALYGAFRGIAARTNRSTGQRFVMTASLEEAYALLEQEQESQPS